MSRTYYEEKRKKLENQPKSYNFYFLFRLYFTTSHLQKIFKAVDGTKYLDIKRRQLCYASSVLHVCALNEVTLSQTDFEF